jgi:RimJ/RimL family protein N-acetyltransferase
MIGARVYLRPAEAEDGSYLAAYYHAEPDAEIWFGGRSPNAPLSKATWLNTSTERCPREIPFSVCRNADDEYVGFVALFSVDYVNRTAESGSFLGPPHRDQGYGTEAKHLLLEYAFERLQLRLIWSVVWERNPRSTAALLKQGYQPAGCCRWRGTQRGAYHDELLFDVLREEWLAARLPASHTIARGTGDSAERREGAYDGSY